MAWLSNIGTAYSNTVKDNYLNDANSDIHKEAKNERMVAAIGLTIACAATVFAIGGTVAMGPAGIVAGLAAVALLTALTLLLADILVVTDKVASPPRTLEEGAQTVFDNAERIAGDAGQAVTNGLQNVGSKLGVCKKPTQKAAEVSKKLSRQELYGNAAEKYALLLNRQIMQWVVGSDTKKD